MEQISDQAQIDLLMRGRNSAARVTDGFRYAASVVTALEAAEQREPPGLEDVFE